MAKGTKDKPRGKPKERGKTAKKVSGKAPKKVLKKAAARVPLPAALGEDTAEAPVPKRVRQAESRHLAPFAETLVGGTARILDELWDTVEGRRLAGDTEHSHSARLLARGTAKVAQKLGEEAVECLIEATMGNRDATVAESADLLYHLIVVWVDAGIRPEEVWAELTRRQGISGIAEKASRQDLSARAIVRGAGTTKLP